jgi:hypothetical protein
LYSGIDPYRRVQLCELVRREPEVVQEKRLRQRAARCGFPLVAVNEVLYHLS